MEITFVLMAFGLGMAAASVNLPPLVGYLTAGFALHGLGYENTGAIDLLADLGVLLLLFGIGLKLRLRTLARPEVWAGASIHMIVTTAILGGVLLAMGAAGLPMVAGITVRQAAVLGFAFSFSSTVFAVKALEERNEVASLPGRIAIGILIVQDLLAVLFLALWVDEPPTWWAIPVVAGLIALRPVLGWIFDRVGHGELLVLFGFSLAIGVGLGAFDEVGLKPDLGALLAGLALANHRRASELSDRLLSIKDLLLIGFFLSIGLGGVPRPMAAAVAAALVVLVPLKATGFLLLLTRFRLRSSTAWHSSVTLATYSEFGLIVTAVGVDRGLVDQQWAATMAVAVAMSFLLAAPLNTARHQVYHRWSTAIGRLERHPPQPDDRIIEPTGARILVFGMGRTGTGAYDELVKRRGEVVLGVDRNDTVIDQNRVAGRRMLRGDSLDRDFWDRLRLHPEIQMVVLATGDHTASLETVRRVRDIRPDILIAAGALYQDEVWELRSLGVDVARNLYDEAGRGLADDACDLLTATEESGGR
ncbi:MAG: cation:proton antiporter [Actinobacteria bacterium]|nr:cation:proton antiporter [Actinomycetota bacterium]